MDDMVTVTIGRGTLTGLVLALGSGAAALNDRADSGGGRGYPEPISRERAETLEQFASLMRGQTGWADPHDADLARIPADVGFRRFQAEVERRIAEVPDDGRDLPFQPRASSSLSLLCRFTLSL